MKKSLFYIICSVLFISSNNLFAFQISFSEENFALRGSSYGALEFGDFDADGDLDLLVLGEEEIGIRVGLIYKNTGSGFNKDSLIVLPYAFSIADAKWGDYDNDGDLDILLSGQTGGDLTTILKNENGNFLEQDYGLLNMKDGAVDWGDYDNDGDLDIAVTGRDFNFNRPLKIYKNESDEFIDSGISLSGIESGDLEWIDYDVDGDLDLLVTGSNGGRQTLLYRQDPAGFTNSGIAFENLLNASSDWGDFDQDGDPDLLLSGNNLDKYCAIFRNDGGSFTELSVTITGVEKSDVKWADFDNDGDLDFILNGESADGDTTQIYENTGGGFSAIDLDLPKLKNSAIAVGDFDNDSDLDFVISGWNSAGDRFTTAFSNNISIANTAPAPPVNLSHTISDGDVVLSWETESGADNQTAADGLSYNLRVGTTQGGSEIVTANVNSQTKHMLSRRGNVEQNLSWTLAELPLGKYYWSVQSVDNNYTVSNFAPEQTFELKISPLFTEIPVGLPAYSNGDLAWGDFDNDGDLDIAMTGFDNGDSETSSLLYRNDGGETFHSSPLWPMLKMVISNGVILITMAILICCFREIQRTPLFTLSMLAILP